MRRDYQEELKEIAGNFACPAKLICYTQALKNFRKVKHVGLETFLEALELHAYACPFQMPVAGGKHLGCPVRAYVSEKLKNGKRVFNFLGDCVRVLREYE
jgi:hypothetical protein